MPAESGTLRVSIKSTARTGFTLDARFDAPPGITVFFGPSGSGKSTALGMIAGLLRPSEGRVTLGEDVWFDSKDGVDRAPHLRGVAYVFQTLALFPHLTATKNVLYGMDKGIASSDRAARAREMLARWKVAHLADRRPATFSGGEAQRVALARAFAMRPRVLLLDEPFSAMDSDLRTVLMGEVRTFVDELGIPAIHVTHHKNEARAIGDRAVLLHAGKVVATGALEELLGPPRSGDMAFEETPLGRPRARDGAGDDGE
jgi:molybdate transport system ATP-binding protein